MSLESLQSYLVAVLAVGIVLTVARRLLAAHRRSPQSQQTPCEPPCPGRLPLLGSILYVRRRPLYTHLAERYPGCDVILLWFGGQRVYCLSSVRAVRAAYLEQAEVFAGRPEQVFNESIAGDVGGLVMMDGPVWRAYRRFTLKTLKDFGVGRSATEDSIREEIAIMREQIELVPGREFDSTKLLGIAVSNIICRFLYGRRLASEEPRFESLQEAFAQLSQEKDNVSQLFTVFIVLTLCGGSGRWAYRFLQLVPEAKRVFDNFKYLLSYCRKIIDQHREKYVPDSQPADYIEAAFSHCGSGGDQQEKETVYNDTRLSLAMTDLLIAGSDTTTSTLRWALVFFHRHPDCYRRAADEVSRKIGLNREPAMRDRAECHYLQAFIEEVHRSSCLVPLSVLHRCLADTELLGYAIPAGSLTLVNNFAINNDPVAFPQPASFRPERFLDAEGRFKPSEHLLPFSVGKRACLGEGLARMELFLFSASLLQRYRLIELIPGQGVDLSEAGIRPTPGDIRAPPPFGVKFHLR